MNIACVLCACVWPIGIGAAWFAGEVDMPRWGRVALVVFACLSFGACAAEDRVCALAECEASP